MRILKPGGKLLLIGFNAFSFMFEELVLVSDDFSESFSNPFRLLDWFALLDLELIETPKYGGWAFRFSKSEKGKLLI